MIVNERNAKRYSFGNNCLGLYFLETPGFNIKLERIPPGSTTSLHYHKGMNQFFFVVSGTLSINTESENFTLLPGEGISLKGHTRHRVYNSHETLLEYIVTERYEDDASTYYD